MYLINYNGTKAEFCGKLENYREEKSKFKQTVNVPAPEEIFPVFKILQDNIQNDDYKLITVENADE